MIIVGCDYHPSFQQIAFVDTETGEVREERLDHREGAEKFYRTLAVGVQRVRVGMEASGHAHASPFAFFGFILSLGGLIANSHGWQRKHVTTLLPPKRTIRKNTLQRW